MPTLPDILKIFALVNNHLNYTKNMGELHSLHSLYLILSCLPSVPGTLRKLQSSHRLSGIFHAFENPIQECRWLTANMSLLNNSWHSETCHRDVQVERITCNSYQPSQCNSNVGFGALCTLLLLYSLNLEHLLHTANHNVP